MYRKWQWTILKQSMKEAKDFSRKGFFCNVAQRGQLLMSADLSSNKEKFNTYTWVISSGFSCRRVLFGQGCDLSIAQELLTTEGCFVECPCWNWSHAWEHAMVEFFLIVDSTCIHEPLNVHSEGVIIDVNVLRKIDRHKILLAAFWEDLRQRSIAQALLDLQVADCEGLGRVPEPESRNCIRKGWTICLQNADV